MSRNTIIAIDGPVASGKSTLGAALAERLGYTYFDSGIVYRALTWLALDRGVDVHDGPHLAQLGREMDIAVERADAQPAPDGRQFTVRLDGQDVTWSVRSPDVDRNVSVVSAHPEVREALTARLRRLAAGGRLVMVGRDIGTVVLPEAALKIYLTASPEERAHRRYQEFQARGLPVDYAAILADLRRRDALDSGRDAAPMQPATDALILDSDHLTVGELVNLAVRAAARARRLEETVEQTPDPSAPIRAGSGRRPKDVPPTAAEETGRRPAG